MTGRFMLLAAAVAATLAPGRVSDMNALAERYVRLALAVGQHDPDFVDAYYGPPAWKEGLAKNPRSLDVLSRETDALSAEVAATPDSASRLRRAYLRGQLSSIAARIRMLSGARLGFDEESKALYDAVAPSYPESHFQDTLGALDQLVPGPGPLAERVEAFRQQYVIPPGRLDAVFRAAIAECRARTAAHLELPPGEQFRLEYVTGKPWSGYNWYQGHYHSLIQVNTDLPIFIDRAVDLACHEGYPGHHVYNALLEQHLVEGRGWREFTVYLLFSPQSLIAEGTANFGIDVAFPGAERVRFESDRLFPLAGLDPTSAPRYYDVLHRLDELGYAGNEAARRYLDGRITAGAAADWLVTYTLSSPARAEQRVRFFDRYRSYVINYNLGKDVVRRYVEAHGGTPDNPDAAWRVFGELISSPRLPSGLGSAGEKGEKGE
jgi:hypothetical protein